MSTFYAVGVDAGGTSTRALVVSETGEAVGSGQSGGGNPNSHLPERAAAHIADALRAALAGLDPGAVSSCVIGMAGASKLSDPAVAALFHRAVEGVGLPIRARVVSDAEAAFASATSAKNGTVLIAGTGSIACRIRDRKQASTVGGYGWLLGDEGSAFWIGRAAVKVTLDALTGQREVGTLGTLVLESTEVAKPDPLDPATALPTAHRLITAVNAETPIDLARFAPLVSAATKQGDPAAERITAEAARLLITTALATRDHAETTPIVLVGSVLGTDSRVGALVKDELRGLEVLVSRNGVFGAAWLAALDAFGEHACHPASV